MASYRVESISSEGKTQKAQNGRVCGAAKDAPGQLTNLVLFTSILSSNIVLLYQAGSLYSLVGRPMEQRA